MNRVLDRIRRQELTSTVIVYLVLAACIVVGAILTANAGRNFFSTGNITAILVATSVLGLIAVGQTLVILGGSLDLSVPFVVSLTSVISAGVMAGQTSNLAIGIAAGLGVGALVGLVNGLVVSLLHVHGFMATLGMSLILSGYLASNYRGNHGSAPPELQQMGRTLIGPVPLSTILLAVMAILVTLWLRRTRTGHHLYAVGGNPDVARLSGVRTSTSVIAAHVMCSMLASMAAIILVARAGIGSPTAGAGGLAAGYDLMSIAAVVLGGAVLGGGKGNVVGTIGGVAIFAVIYNVMSVMQVNSFLRQAVLGLIIVVAVAIYARRDTNKRPPRFGGPLVAGAATGAGANASASAKGDAR